MTSREARIVSNILDAERSALNLQKARQEAFKARNYNSEATRMTLHAEFTKRNNGLAAYDWQVDVSEALLLGLDCSVIAGTGRGKTMPFVMPLFVETDKIVVIISPLNALEEDQASRFEKMGLSSVAVNGDTYNNMIHKEIEQFKHRVIITSPDMCLEHDTFRQLLNSATFAEKVCAIVIDEAHCIAQWGDKFRPLYAQLGTLRAFVPLKIPFLVTSATLPPSILAQVRTTVHMQSQTSYHINLGTDRPNIAWFVHRMSRGKSNLEALAFLVPQGAGKEQSKLNSTMVFFDDINLALEALKWIRHRLPPYLRGQIAVFHSRRSKRAKKRIIKGFSEGQINILLTTEAAGMGCDIPHIEQVVQFMVPKSLSIWMQRAGRGGRNPMINAQAILLVQPSVFQEVKPTNKNPQAEESEAKYRKDVEEGLREWIETEECRRDASENYFNDGIPRKDPSGICCDNCLRKSEPNHPLLVLTTGSSIDMSSQPISPSGSTELEDMPALEVNNNGKRQMTTSAKTTNRRDKHLQGAKDLLSTWRTSKWMEMYRRRPWGIQCLLPDAVMTSLATKSWPKSVSDLEDIGWSPIHAK